MRNMERVNLSQSLSDSSRIRKEMYEHYNTDISRCYQCGKCTAGCPAAFAMDYTPRQIVRLLQAGLKEEALQSRTIWICASCDTCSTRCPKEVDLARLMEGLRLEAKSKGMIGHKNSNAFHDVFLQLVKRFGRVHEAGLIVFFNLFSLQPFKDVLYGPVMFIRGKINPLPEKIKDNGEIKKIFNRARTAGGAK